MAVAGTLIVTSIMFNS